MKLFVQNYRDKFRKFMIKSNKLFCYPDTLQNKFIPQAWQITIMGEFIKKEDREISFYTGENHKTYKKLSLFKKKMISQNNLKVSFFIVLYNFVMIKIITFL